MPPSAGSIRPLIGALLFLQGRSFLNLLRLRIRRLRQPRYFIGALVGVAYFGWYFGGALLLPIRHRSPADWTVSGPEERWYWEGVTACGLLVWLALGWLLPGRRAALSFTETELTYLLPAPVTRRQLIHYKLVRSQAGLLFASFLFTLLSGRLLRGVEGLLHLAGWWLVLFTLNLHALGASFTMTRWLDRGLSAGRRRLLVGVLLAGVAGVVAVGWHRAAPASPVATDLAGLRAWTAELMATPAGGVVLAPFRWVVRPWFAVDVAGFLRALPPVVLLLGLLYGWVMRSEVAFEEATLDLARRRSQIIDSARSGQSPVLRAPRRSRPPFRLAPRGFAPVALLWKNLIAAGSMWSPRMFLLSAVWVSALSAVLASAGRAGHGGNFLQLAWIVGLTLLVLSLTLGTQLFRQDFRNDMTYADQLRLVPLPPWQVVLGEMATPAAILTVLQWLLLIFVGTLTTQVPMVAEALPLRLVVAIGLAAGLVCPLFNLVSLVVPNAAVLLFPAWVRPIRDQTAGFEVMGQRLVFLLGQSVVMLVAVLPASVLGGMAFVSGYLASGPVVATLAASAGAGIILAIEAALGVWWLGRRFTALDLSADG